jgi:predicted esterase YcpF (UPF0227 family)
LRIKDCKSRHRNGGVHTTLGGYVYTTALEMFKDRLTMLEAPSVDPDEDLNEEIDLVHNDWSARLIVAEIDRPNFEMAHTYIRTQFDNNDFNNDELPY